MATLVDGMGGEELGDAGGYGDLGSKSSALWLTGSIVTQSDLTAAGTISGAGNVYGTVYYGGAFSGAGIYSSTDMIGSGLRNYYGGVHSIFYDSGNSSISTSGYGARIQTGNLTTSAGSAATIAFKNAFAVGSYAIFFSAAAATAQGSINAYTSGALRASGCEVIGAPTQGYNWVAFGI